MTSNAFFRASLPLPPSANAAHAVARGRIVSAVAQRQFKRDAALLLSQGYTNWDALRDIFRFGERIPLGIQIDIYFPPSQGRKNRRDGDNCVKVTQDVVFDHLQINDECVDQWRIDAHRDAEEPRVEVAVYRLGVI